MQFRPPSEPETGAAREFMIKAREGADLHIRPRPAAPRHGARETLGQGFSARMDNGLPRSDPAAVDAMVAAADRAGPGLSSPRVAAIDPVERLPTAAAEKLRRLRAIDEDLGVVIRDLSGRKNGAIQRRTEATVRLQRVKQELAPLGGLGTPENEHPSERQAIQLRDAAEREVKELDERIAVLRGQRWGGLRSLERYVSELPASAPIEMHDAGEIELPKLKPGGIAAAIEAVRRDITRIAADLHEVRSACLPSGVVKARMREQVAVLVKRGAIDVLPVIERRSGAPLWPTLHVRAELYGHAAVAEGGAALTGFATHNGPDLQAVMAWLFQDKLMEKLEAEIDALADDDSALSDEQRAEREAALSAELLQTERREELLIMAAEAEGLNVMRRNVPDPRALLELSSELPAQRR